MEHIVIEPDELAEDDLGIEIIDERSYKRPSKLSDFYDQIREWEVNGILNDELRRLQMDRKLIDKVRLSNDILILDASYLAELEQLSDWLYEHPEIGEVPIYATTDEKNQSRIKITGLFLPDRSFRGNHSRTQFFQDEQYKKAFELARKKGYKLTMGHTHPAGYLPGPSSAGEYDDGYGSDYKFMEQNLESNRINDIEIYSGLHLFLTPSMNSLGCVRFNTENGNIEYLKVMYEVDGTILEI